MTRPRSSSWAAVAALCVVACAQPEPARQAAQAPVASPFAFFGARAGLSLEELRAVAIRQWWQPLECVPLPGGAHRCSIERVTMLAAGGPPGRVEVHADSTGRVTWVSFLAHDGSYDLSELAAEVEREWTAAAAPIQDTARVARRWVSADGRWAALMYVRRDDGRTAGFASMDLPGETRLLARYARGASDTTDAESSAPR